MRTLLIVEDELNIRKFIAINLRKRGFTVLEAGDAESGLQQLYELQPDALLLDIRLPRMSGWDLLDLMQNAPRIAEIPVVVMTASASIDSLPIREYPNLVARLAKPVSVLNLLQVVEQAYDHQSQTP